MNGYEPGLNEWPHKGRFKHNGGSTSTLPKSANFEVLVAPNKVLVFDFDVLSKVDCSCLVLKWLPFNKWTKHYAVWKK